MWGPGLLDEAALKEQAALQKKAETTWGSGFDLPPDDTVNDAIVVEASSTTTKEMGLSIAAIEQRLAEDPTWWEEALALEFTRTKPRKAAVRAIIRVGEQNGASEELVTKTRDAIGAL